MAEYVDRLVWRGVTLIPRADGQWHFRFAYRRQDGAPPPRSYDAAAARAELIAVLRGVLEREGIDPDDPIPAVWQTKETSVTFIIAEYLVTFQALEAALSQGADMEEIIDIAKEIGVLRERMAWTGLKDPEVGATLAQLAQVEPRTAPGRRRGQMTNAQKAAGVRAKVLRIAKPIVKRKRGISQRQLAHEVHAMWPVNDPDGPPSESNIRKHLKAR